MLIDRGIMCEYHVQVISTHCTNVPDEEDIRAVVEKHRTEFERMFDGGIVATQGLPGGEEIGLLILRGILTKVAEEAEELWIDRLLAKRQGKGEEAQPRSWAEVDESGVEGV